MDQKQIRERILAGYMKRCAALDKLLAKTTELNSEIEELILHAQSAGMMILSYYFDMGSARPNIVLVVDDFKTAVKKFRPCMIAFAQQHNWEINFYEGDYKDVHVAYLTRYSEERDGFTNYQYLNIGILERKDHDSI